MKANILRNRVTFQRFTITKDEYLNEEKVYVDMGTVWANIRNVSGKEYAKNGIDSANVTTSIRCRLNTLTSQVTEQDRIVFKGRIYNINAALPNVVDGDYVDFACTMGDSEG